MSSASIAILTVQTTAAARSPWACSAQTKAGWQPEQEAEVAAYLNQQFYHFKE